MQKSQAELFMELIATQGAWHSAFKELHELRVEDARSLQDTLDTALKNAPEMERSSIVRNTTMGMAQDMIAMVEGAVQQLSARKRDEIAKLEQVPRPTQPSIERVSDMALVMFVVQASGISVKGEGVDALDDLVRVVRLQYDLAATVPNMDVLAVHLRAALRASERAAGAVLALSESRSDATSAAIDALGRSIAHMRQISVAQTKVANMGGVGDSKPPNMRLLDRRFIIIAQVSYVWDLYTTTNQQLYAAIKIQDMCRDERLQEAVLALYGDEVKALFAHDTETDIERDKTTRLLDAAEARAAPAAPAPAAPAPVIEQWRSVDGVLQVHGTDAHAAVRAGLEAYVEPIVALLSAKPAAPGMPGILDMKQDGTTVSGHVDGITVEIKKTQGSATLKLGASAVVTVKGTGGTG
jgi:hypothetical protein